MTATPARRRNLLATETGKHEFKRARAWVANSDFLAVVNKDMTAKTGRPRVVGWEAMLTLLALTAMKGKGRLILMEAWHVAEGLTAEQRRDLHIGAVEYQHIESALADLKNACHPTVDAATGEILRGQRLTVPLTDLCNMIVRATIPSCIAEPADQAIDSTDYETSARRRSWGKHALPDVVDGSLPQDDYKTTRPNSGEPGWPRVGEDGRLQHTCDPDARDGYRSGKNLEPSEVFCGYDLHLSCDVTPLGQEQGVPPLVRAMHLAPAGSSKGKAALNLIDSARRLGSPLVKVLVDRGYAYLRAENWAFPLWQRNIEQVLDLHTNQHVTRPGPLPGTVWVDSDLFLATLPRALRLLPRYSLGMSGAEIAALAGEYDKREPYAFTPYGSRDALRGTQRYRGPALTGRVRCPNNPKSMRLHPSTRPTTTCAKSAPCACGKTITLGPDDLLQTRQRHLYGTTKWKADYGRRSAVESANSNLKKHHARLERGSTLVFGCTKNAILTAFIIGATNLRLLLSRYELDLGEPTPDGPVQPVPQKQQKKQKSLHSRVFKRRTRPRPAPTASGPPPTTEWATPS